MAGDEVTPEERRDLIRKRLSNLGQAPKPAEPAAEAPKPEPTPDPMAEFESDYKTPDTKPRWFDPSDNPGPHIPDLYTPAQWYSLVNTYKGRMFVNSLLYDDTLCRGCKHGIRDQLREGAPGARWN